MFDPSKRYQVSESRLPYEVGVGEGLPYAVGVRKGPHWRVLAERIHVALEDLDLSFMLQMSAFLSELAAWVPVKEKSKLSKKAKMDSRTKWE